MRNQFQFCAAVAAGLMQAATWPHQATAAGACDAMQPGTLSAIPSGCSGPTCVVQKVHVEGANAYLCSKENNGGDCLSYHPLQKQDGYYTFFYKTPKSDITVRSVVAVQQYALPDKNFGQKTYGRVALSRDAAKFACTPSGQRAYPDKPTNVKTVSFEHYDDYHRSFLPGFGGELKTLSEFHFNYQNNRKNFCRSGWAAWLRPGGVRTDDPMRRPLFLLYDRDNFYSPGFSTLYGRVVKPILNSAVGTVFGQLVTGDENSKVALRRFAQFKVHMTNYQVSAGDSGCFSFPVSTYTEGSREVRLPLKEVDVTLRDLEQLQLVGPPDMFSAEKTTWDFPIE